MGPLPLSGRISVYICRVRVWYNVVGKDPRWGPLPGLCVCISVYISILYVCCVMLSVRTQYKAGIYQNKESLCLPEAELRADFKSLSCPLAQGLNVRNKVVRNLMKYKNPAKNIKDACEAGRGKA